MKTQLRNPRKSSKLNPESVGRVLQPEAIGNLLHLISLAFAVSLAYLAIERFKVTNRILEIYHIACARGDQTLTSNNNATLTVIDISLTDLKYKKTEIDKNGLWLYGKSGKTGRDEWFIICLLIAQFTSLYFAVLHTDFILKSKHCYDCMRGAAFLGLLLPALSIFYGRLKIKSAEKRVAAVLEKLERGVKGYKESIEKLAFETNTTMR